MINNVTISQERYNELKLKADLCMRFKKGAEDALDVAREAQEMAGRLLEDNTRLAEENSKFKQALEIHGLLLKKEEEEEEEVAAVAITNAEKYKDDIAFLEKTCFGGHTGLGFSLAVLKDTGNVANCYDISCDDCAFCRFDERSPYSMMGCSECREYWLQQPAEVEVHNDVAMINHKEEVGTLADFICSHCEGCRINKKPADKEDK